MPRSKPELSEGARKAYAAQRAEKLKLLFASVLTAVGLGCIFVVVFVRDAQDATVSTIQALPLHLSNPLLYVGIAILLIGLLAYRTTVAWEIAKQGPRFPRRIRLPFDSTVEIGVSVNQVQQRTGMIVGDRRGKDDGTES